MSPCWGCRPRHTQDFQLHLDAKPPQGMPTGRKRFPVPLNYTRREFFCKIYKKEVEKRRFKMNFPIHLKEAKLFIILYKIAHGGQKLSTDTTSIYKLTVNSSTSHQTTLHDYKWQLLKRKSTLTDWHFAILNVFVVHIINTIEAERYESHLWKNMSYWHNLILKRN